MQKQWALGIGGGKMDEKQIKKEYEKLVQETSKKSLAILKEADEKGILKPGLDSNEDLFAEVKEEARKKLDLLKAKVRSK